MKQASNQDEVQVQAKAVESKASGLSWAKVLPGILFVIISIGIVFIFTNPHRIQENNSAELKELNQKLGLPADFPLDVIPLYPGVEILATENSDALSTDGEQMDHWYIHAQIDSIRKPILDFYHDLMLSRGMAQTLSISVPAQDGSGANYAANYADEELLVEFSIEKKASDEITQLEIKVYRVR